MSDTTWFSDPDEILAALQSDRRERSGRPRIAGYDDLEEIHRGGQGVVYSAIQKSTRRRVAIKVLLEGVYASAAARRRFEREIDLAASLRHPNVVTIFDSGATADGFPYFVMEYIPGETLDVRIGASSTGFGASRSGGKEGAEPSSWRTRELPATIETELRLFVKICDGVAYAHQNGVIHRDLKPRNIRVDEAGEPHVLDFGLAKLAANDDAAQTVTQSGTGHFIGSLPWASPEQVTGGTVDVRTDVYSLGVILSQMLTGVFPYDVSGTFMAVSRSIVERDPIRPSALRRDVHADLDAIVLKCLAKDPGQRYQTAGELSADVRRFMAGEPILAQRETAWKTLRRRAKRYRVALISISTAAAALLVVAGALAYMVRQTATARAAEQRAREAAQQQATEAEAARKRAESETGKAVAIRKFLEETFAFITPERARGRDSTLLSEAMDDAVRRLPAASAEQPENEAVLRRVIGSVFSSLSRYDEAEPHLMRALELGRSALGSEHSETLSALNNMGVLRMNQGRMEEAYRVLSEAVAARTSLLGATDRDTLVCRANLAVVAKRMGRLVEAQRMYDELLPAVVEKFGEEHEETLRVMVNLAGLMAAQGNLKEAARLDRRAYEARLRVSGADHRETMSARSNLALSLSTMDEFDEAEALLRDNLERSRRILGATHDDTLITVNNLAHLLQRRKNLEEAERLFREAYETRRERLGEENSNTLISMSNLAMCLLDAGKRGEAEPLVRRALEIRRRTLGEKHLETLIAMNNLASFLGDEASAELNQPGVPSEAEQLYRTAATRADETLGADHWISSLFHGNLGGLLLNVERLEEAEPELMGAYERLHKALGEGHTHTRGVAQKLARLYAARNDAEEAAAWEERAKSK